MIAILIHFKEVTVKASLVLPESWVKPLYVTLE